MTKELARRFYKNFQLDAALILDKSQYKPFEYSNAWSDHRVERYAVLGRIFFAIMLDDEPIGEIVLKDIDYVKSTYVIGISLQNDQYKNKGIGTAALNEVLNYAFTEKRMKTVYADAVITNQRSRKVLKDKLHRDPYKQYIRILSF